MKGFGKKVMALFLGTCLLFGAACSNGEAEPAGNGGGNTSAAGAPRGTEAAARVWGALWRQSILSRTEWNT